MIKTSILKVTAWIIVLLPLFGCSREQILRMKGWKKTEYKQSGISREEWRKNDEQFILEAKRKLEIDPNNSMALYTLGIVYSQDNKTLKLANGYLRKSAEKDDEMCASVAIYFTETNPNVDRPYIEGLIQRSLKTITVNDSVTKKALLYEKIGVINANVKNYVDAMKYLRLALALQPDDICIIGKRSFMVMPGTHTRIENELKKVEELQEKTRVK